MSATGSRGNHNASSSQNLMATSPGNASKSSNQSFGTTTSTPISYSFFKTVYLQDWWLVKADRDFHGKRLAIGGIASREWQAVRGFSSAPIVKRLDTFTLETSDGITIAIKGLINSSRTHQNGFSTEVCNHFLFGFPYYWEDYAAQCFGTCNGGVPTSISDFNEKIMHTYNGGDHDLPHHFRDLPGTKMCDQKSGLGISDNCVLTKGIFNDILQKLSSNDFMNPGVSIHSYLNRSSASMAGACFAEETPSRCKVLLTEELRNNLNCDGSNGPKSIVPEGNIIMKSHDSTDDVAENSVFPENMEANLVGVEFQMSNSTSEENGGTKSISEISKRRKWRSYSRLENQWQRHSPRRLDGLKCCRKDEKKTVSGSDVVNLNVASHVGEKSCCGKSSSLGSDGLGGTIEESSSNIRPVGCKKSERPNESTVRRSSLRIRNLKLK